MTGIWYTSHKCDNMDVYQIVKIVCIFISTEGMKAQISLQLNNLHIAVEQLVNCLIVTERG